MRVWDTHCHLADQRFAADRGDVAARAVAAGVEVAVVVAADPRGWDAAKELQCSDDLPTPEGANPGGPRPGSLRLLFAYGLHPHEARLAAPELWATLEGHLTGEAVVALGEIGLDYHYDFSPRAIQRQALERQLTMAAERRLPIVLHEREAAADLLAVLRGVGIPPCGGLWHCFSGDPELADQAVDLGLHLGFGGLITFRRGTEAIREAAVRCPADRLVLETDAPYLAPVPHRGRRNEPAYVVDVLATLADLRGIQPEELADLTTRNAEDLFLRRRHDAESGRVDMGSAAP